MKSGAKRHRLVYSHLIYDVVPEGNKVIEQPDISSWKGLTYCKAVWIILTIRIAYRFDSPTSLYMSMRRRRYCKAGISTGFPKFRQGAFSNSDSYFHNWFKIIGTEAINIATQLWNEITDFEFAVNILPTRERASLIGDQKRQPCR